MAIDETRPLQAATARTPDVRGVIHSRSPLDTASPMEERQRAAMDRLQIPYVVYRDRFNRQRLVKLDQDEVMIGRSEGTGIALDFDHGVSRHHATMQRTSMGWAIIDDGHSLNGTLVNGKPIEGSMLLKDRDLLQVGETALAFRDPTVDAAAR